MTQITPNPHLRRDRYPRSASRQALLLTGCLLLTCGYLYAVLQKILAMYNAYKTKALRREREELLDEQRRLLLAVEESSSPARLEEAGRGLGMRPARAAQIEAAAARETRPEAGVFVGTAGAGAVLRR